MCLAIPALVIALLENDLVDVEVGGVHTRISTALIEPVALGDYVIVHAGFAIALLDVLEAEKSLALFEEIITHLNRVGNALHPRLS
jgi:hydrogenase expression/formation protein HypC